MQPLIVVCGVSGAGKTTLGVALAAHFSIPFCDADDLHPPSNVAKMRGGVPLDDADRAPWLAACAAWLAERGAGGGVLACSALRRRHRAALALDGARAPRFVFIHGDAATLRARVAARAAAGAHFMPAALFDSQLAALEPPGADEAAVRVDAALAPPAALALAARAVL
jgi:gluconokinase